jgi:hypothetical protein
VAGPEDGKLGGEISLALGPRSAAVAGAQMPGASANGGSALPPALNEGAPPRRGAGPGVSLGEKGFTAGVLREKYGYPAGASEKAEEFLHGIRLREDIPPEGFLALSAAVEAALARNAGKSLAALREDIQGILGGNENGYGGFVFTGPEAAGVLPNRPMPRNPRWDSGIRRLVPVYRSGEWKLPLKRGVPRCFPEALLPPGPAEGFAPLGLKGRGGSPGMHGDAAESRKGGQAPAAALVSGGPVSASGSLNPNLKPKPLPPGRAAASMPTVPLSFPKGGGPAPLAAASGPRPSVSAIVAHPRVWDIPAGPVSRASPAGAGVGAFPASAPPSRQNEAELERLRRIEANYERDKALLARERQPLLALRASHGMERADEAAGTPLEADTFAIQRMNDKFGRLIKEALNEGL